MMSIEVLESDPNVWSDQSFFNVDYNQTQHSCGITSKSGSGETEWCVEDVEEFWDSFGLDFDNEPSLALEVMNNEVESQTKPYELDSSYLNASTFLSPISISPSSPTSPTSPLTPFSPELTDDNFEHQLHSSNISEKSDESFNEDLDNSSALELLEQILSANSSDNEDSQQELYAINAGQYFTEAVDESPLQTIPDIESESIVTEITTSNESHKRPKRQVKRKTISDTDSEPRETKRKKVLVNKKERKKDQNRSAANRYRLKKRIEQESIDVLQSEQMKINEKLRVQLEKLQMEFKVVYPLATMAFANNHQKNLILQMLNIRVMKDNLLDKPLD